jgi:hypothetical protein
MLYTVIRPQRQWTWRRMRSSSRPSAPSSPTQRASPLRTGAYVCYRLLAVCTLTHPAAIQIEHDYGQRQGAGDGQRRRGGVRHSSEPPGRRVLYVLRTCVQLGELSLVVLLADLQQNGTRARKWFSSAEKSVCRTMGSALLVHLLWCRYYTRECDSCFVCLL